MKALLLATLLLGCSQQQPEDKLAKARHAADEAKAAAVKAEAEAEAARLELEKSLAEQAKAVEENEVAKQKLGEVRAEAARTIALAHKKLDELGAAAKDLDAKIAQARLAKDVGLAALEQKRRAIGEEIDKLAQMTREIETSLPK